MACHSLLDGNVLANEAGDFMSLVSLDAGDSLLHQVAALHVKEKFIFALHLASAHHFRQGVPRYRLLLSDEC